MNPEEILGLLKSADSKIQMQLYISFTPKMSIFNVLQNTQRIAVSNS